MPLLLLGFLQEKKGEKNNKNKGEGAVRLYLTVGLPLGTEAAMGDRSGRWTGGEDRPAGRRGRQRSRLSGWIEEGSRRGEEEATAAMADAACVAPVGRGATELSLFLLFSGLDGITTREFWISLVSPVFVARPTRFVSPWSPPAFWAPPHPR